MSAAPILAAEGLALTIGGRTILAPATFALDAGQFVALVGPNGAGKTSLLKALAGLAPSVGIVRLGGERLRDLAPKVRARRIALLPQGHVVHWPLAARAIVALGRYPHGAGDPLRLAPADAAIVDAAMARTGTAEFAARSILDLSGGERARVMLARVFAVQAPILLADEPTAALDPYHQLAVMRDLAAEAARGVLVVAVTHDLTLAARLAHHVILMDHGHIVGDGPPEAVLTPANLARVYRMRAIRQRIGNEALLVPWEIDAAGPGAAPDRHGPP